MREDTIKRIIRAYDNRLVRYYCLGRFQILRQRFLDEIGQYLPPAGRVLDIGCGFGLFSLYFATIYPDLFVQGVDIDARRISMARNAAEKLGIRNVQYEVVDACALDISGAYQGVYMLDLVHHIPPGAVRPLIEKLRALLNPAGRLIIKDVDTLPRYKRLFTFVLDKLMSPGSPVCYWSRPKLMETLSDLGFEVYHHAMVDYLPYPHMLYICQPRRRH